MPHINKQQDDVSYNEEEYKQYRKYRKQTKQKFCHMVCREGKTINAAARLLHINEATAKTIIKSYRELHPEETVPVARPGRKPKDRSKKRQIILPSHPKTKQEIKAEQVPLVLKEQPLALPVLFPLPLPGFLLLPPIQEWEDPAVKHE